MKKIFAFMLASAASALLLVSCGDMAGLEKQLESMKSRIDALENSISEANDNATALSRFVKGNIIIVAYQASEDGYTLELSDGSKIKVTFGDKAAKLIPLISVDKDGNWVCSYDGGKTFNPVPGASSSKDVDGYTPLIALDEEHFWTVSTDGGKTFKRLTDAKGKPMNASEGSSFSDKSSVFSDVSYSEKDAEMVFTLPGGQQVKVPVLDTFYMKVQGYKENTKVFLSETLTYDVELSDVANAVLKTPQGWSAKLTDKQLIIISPAAGESGDCVVDVVLVSGKGFIKTVSLKFAFVAEDEESAACASWKKFVKNDKDNLLLDFSFAGYMHGETAPPEVSALSYQTYNVLDYGAVPNDGKSDREAFLAAYRAAIGAGGEHNPSAKAVIYFPEGEFILHTSDDDNAGKSHSLLLRAGDFVLKGAGRDKTTIVMQDPNRPNSAQLYSSPVMIELKHNSGLKKLTDVTADAEKGSFSVEVASTSGIAAGDWVCLSVQNNDKDMIAEELHPHKLEPGMSDLASNGVRVVDYHRVVSISGNRLTFKEPLMHKVASKWKWEVSQYPHYENVGVEDITFKGNAKEDFVHHASWEDDGAYKLVNFTRITNGWMRRVRFTSVSEASSITNCANVSVYDVIIDGNRGHSSIRSQQSSRVFIGAVLDKSDGHITGTKIKKEGVGQYHAVGVSKPSIGTVLWRNTWGSDSCFEAHATQPRATLIDHCKGGWMPYRQGGDESQVPNHLADLTIWNFESETAVSGEWKWWDSGKWWKFLPPLVIGFHGQPCNFSMSQTGLVESNGTSVLPESLYEAQLRRRLGAVPAWLNELRHLQK